MLLPTRSNATKSGRRRKQALQPTEGRLFVWKTTIVRKTAPKLCSSHFDAYIHYYTYHAAISCASGKSKCSYNTCTLAQPNAGSDSSHGAVCTGHTCGASPKNIRTTDVPFVPPISAVPTQPSTPSNPVPTQPSPPPPQGVPVPTPPPSPPLKPRPCRYPWPCPHCQLTVLPLPAHLLSQSTPSEPQHKPP